MPFKPTIPTVCATCGKNFLAPKPASTRQPTKFCGMKCAEESRAETLEHKFWKSVVKNDSCWLWTAYTVKFGYGQFSHRGKVLLAHRASWELHNGPIPKGVSVLHNCPGGDNPACVNPAHLWLGSQAANSRDMWQKGRGRAGGPKGVTHGHAKLVDADVIALRQRYSDGESLCSLARDYKMPRVTITRAVYGQTWAHIPGALPAPVSPLTHHSRIIPMRVYTFLIDCEGVCFFAQAMSLAGIREAVLRDQKGPCSCFGWKHYENLADDCLAALQEERPPGEYELLPDYHVVAGRLYVADL